MGTLVEKHAAALAAPGRSPATARVVRGSAEPVSDDPTHALDGSQFAALDDAPDGLIVGIGPLIEHRPKDLALLALVGLDEAFAVGFVNRDRLFQQDVEPVFKCVDSDRGVVVVGGGDEDRVDHSRPYQLAGVIEMGDVGKSRKFGGVDVADGSKLRTRDVREPTDVGGAHVPNTDDSKTDHW